MTREDQCDQARLDRYPESRLRGRSWKQTPKGGVGEFRELGPNLGLGRTFQRST